MKTFSERVVDLALSIPEGKVTTYGHIAKAAGGGAMASRSVTNILSKAHQAGVKDIPWHRIVYADGSVWLGNTEHAKQRLELYRKEKILLDKSHKIQNLRDIIHEFK